MCSFLLQVHQSVLVIEGPGDAVDMVAAEIRQTIAAGRAEEDMPRKPISAYPLAGAKCCVLSVTAPPTCRSLVL